MDRTVLDILREQYPEHEIDYEPNADGYSDVEIIIDHRYTNIWVDDYALYHTESHPDFQFDYEYIKGEVESYLTKTI